MISTLLHIIYALYKRQELTPQRMTSILLHAIRVFYNLSGLGLILCIMVYAITYIDIRRFFAILERFPVIFMLLFFGFAVLMAFSMGLGLKLGQTFKSGAFFRYQPRWFAICIGVCICCGVINTILLMSPLHENDLIKKYQQPQVHRSPQEIQEYQHAQIHGMRYTSGSFLLLYSLPLIMCGMTWYAPLETFMRSLSETPRGIRRKVIKTLLKLHNLHVLEPLRDRFTDPLFRKTCVAGLAYGDSRAIPLLLPFLEDRQTTFQTSLDTILQYTCQFTHVIVFGHPVMGSCNYRHTLVNPNIVTLRVSFPHLKHIIIDTTTADFYQVERFLTYAINYIGQSYLKKHVEVSVYGEPEKLHVNLRNNLTYLCRHMSWKGPMQNGRSEMRTRCSSKEVGNYQ